MITHNFYKKKKKINIKCSMQLRVALSDKIYFNFEKKNRNKKKCCHQIFYNFFHININQYKYDQHFFFFNFTNLHCMNDSLWFCWAFTICPGSWCRRFPTIVTIIMVSNGC